MTTGAHIEMEGDNTTTERAIVTNVDYEPYTLEYNDADWPSSDISFWNWFFYHFDE